MSQQALPRGLALCFPAVPPGLCLRAVSVPCRGRSHSAENAAVLTLQRTQRKDRRAYDGLYWNPCKAAAPQRKGRDRPSGRHHRRTGIS